MSLSRRVFRLLATLAMGLGFASGASSEVVRVSYQPRETALPFFIASEKGFWKDVGLEPEVSMFPAGPQQISAMKSWDVGITGSPPAVLGAVRFGLLTIAVATNESALNAMVARSSDAQAILRDPATLKGKQLLVSTNTTGEYAALACLKKLGLTAADMQIVNLGPAQIISAFSSGSGMIAASWTPNIYALMDKGGITEICNGREGGAIITSDFVVRSDFAKERPDIVAKALAVYLHAVSWAKKHPAEAVEYLKKYNEKAGIVLSRASLERTYQRSAIFSLSEELALFDRAKGKSTVDTWMTDLSKYLVGTGTLAALPDPQTYLDDHFLKMVDSDTKLRAFANDE